MKFRRNLISLFRRKEIYMFSNKYELEFSVSVIPVVKTEKSYIDIIQRAMQRVIPYIEELTRVRYYPVTTYLVD